LLSLGDEALGSPITILAALNEMPLVHYPWPGQLGNDDDFPVERSTMLLSLGFMPLCIQPEYAKEAELLNSPVSSNKQNKFQRNYSS
jgi:hypothetical protein